MNGHNASSLSFDNISYTVSSKNDGNTGLYSDINVLEGIQGSVAPGELMAIMGIIVLT